MITIQKTEDHVNIKIDNAYALANEKNIVIGLSHAQFEELSEQIALLRECNHEVVTSQGKCPICPEKPKETEPSGCKFPDIHKDPCGCHRFKGGESPPLEKPEASSECLANPSSRIFPCPCPNCKPCVPPEKTAVKDENAIARMALRRLIHLLRQKREIPSCEGISLDAWMERTIPKN